MTTIDELITKRQSQYKISNPWRANVIIEILQDLKQLKCNDCNEVEIEKCNVCSICQNKEATRLLCEWCYEDIFNY